MTDKLIAENVNDLIFCVLIRSFFFFSLSFESTSWHKIYLRLFGLSSVSHVSTPT